MAKVENLATNERMTVQQVCLSAREFEDAQDILIVGHAEDGHLFARSSSMTRADALWLCEQLRLHVLDL